MNKGIVGFLILLIFNYIILVFVVDYGNEDNGAYKTQIERLQDENSQLVKFNNQLDQEVAQLIESRDSLTAEIHVKATDRNNIKTERDEEMDNINELDNNELYSFFTNFKTDSINGQP